MPTGKVWVAPPKQLNFVVKGGVGLGLLLETVGRQSSDNAPVPYADEFSRSGAELR